MPPAVRPDATISPSLLANSPHPPNNFVESKCYTWVYNEGSLNANLHRSMSLSPTWWGDCTSHLTND